MTVPLPRECFQQVGKRFPQNKRWEDIVKKEVPAEATRPSNGRALLQLLITVSFLTVSVVLLKQLPWFLLPLGWITCGMAATGLFVVGRSAKHNSFVKSSVLNYVVGVLASFPVLSFESPIALEEVKRRDQALRDANDPEFRPVHAVQAGWVCTTLTLFAVFAWALLHFSGLGGVLKYWLLPFIAYQLWMLLFSTLTECAPEKTDDASDITLRARLPAWIEFLSNGANLSFLPNVPSYRLKGALSALHARYAPYVNESQLTIQSLTTVFTRSWDSWRDVFSRINYLHVTILLGTPAIGLWGYANVPAQHKTLVWAFVYYFLTGFGITGGYHRLWAHKAYSVAKPVELVLSFLASGSVQGSCFWWSRGHRAHHRYTDTPKDPYAATRGFFYAHMGWMLVHRSPQEGPIGYSDISDLRANPILRFQHKTYLLQVVLMGFVVPSLVAGLLWDDYLGGFIYAGVCRLVAVHHSTFCVNSVAHYFGEQAYDDELSPKDHIITALLTLGEGNHSYHHSFPSDYRNGEWTAWDPTKWTIMLLYGLGLAYDLKTFPDNEVRKGRLRMKQKQLDIEKKTLTWPKTPQELPVMTLADVEKRCNAGETLVVVDGIVHDLNEFVEDHPGGEKLLRAYVGKDASDAFNGGVYKHSRAARNLLGRMRIGSLPQQQEHDDDKVDEGAE